MKIIDNARYYTLNEVIDKINNRTGLKLKINNALRQWFYRKNHFFNKVKKIGWNYYYHKDIVKEILDYYYRKTEIERIEKKIKQDTLKDRQELKILRKLNKTFIIKYDKNYVNKSAESN